MFAQDFILPDRPIKVDATAISRPGGMFLAVIVLAAIIAFFAVWQVPSLERDTKIRANPLVLPEAEVRDGECTTRKGFFVDCSAHIVYDYQGQHYEADVSLFFIDLHSGDYTVDVMIAADQPELATLSIGLEKYWNRVLLLAAFLLLFAWVALAGVIGVLRADRAQRKLARPGRLTLVPVAVEEGRGAMGRQVFSYEMAGGKPAATQFKRGVAPLILWDGEGGSPQGYAVQHADTPVPVLLDRGLKRLELTEAERAPLLAAIARADAAYPAPTVTKKAFGLLGRLGRMLRNMLLLVLLLLAGLLGWWLYYVLASENSHDPIGMDINNIMPEPINAWACDQLQLRFGDRNAPYGCTAADYVSWK